MLILFFLVSVFIFFIRNTRFSRTLFGSGGPAQRGAAMSFSIQWGMAFMHGSSCGCFCGCTHGSTGSHWKVAVSRRELALQDCPCWGVRWRDAECWRQQNRVCVGSVNRCEMPMAGRGHLHPPAHRVDQMGKIRAAKGRGSCQSIGYSGEVGPHRIHTKPNNCSRLRKGETLQLIVSP